MSGFNANVNNVARELPNLLESDMAKQVISDYQVKVLAYLDCGAFGQVYAIDQTNQPRSVLKVLQAKDSSEEACKKMLNGAKYEAEMVGCLDHPNIIKLLRSKAYANPFQPQVAGYFTMQFEMCSTSLRKFILENQRNGTLENSSIVENLLNQIGGALKYMHELRFVHHDMKPDNIMVVNKSVPKHDLQFKLIDFGLAQTYPPDMPLDSSLERRFAGTEWYMGHEKLTCHPRYAGPVVPYNPFKADVYALGITCLECALGYEEEIPNDPQYNSRDASLLRMLSKIPSTDHLSEPVRLSLLRMLWKNERDRSQMHEILK